MLPMHLSDVLHGLARGLRSFLVSGGWRGGFWLRLSSLAGVIAIGASTILCCPRPARALDLSKMHIVFDEDFVSMSVSAQDPGTRWTAHTPWGGDFGDAKFVDPSPGFPFTVAEGIGRIEMRKSAKGEWRSGLLSSEDPKRNGFTLQYGYFEIRAKLPPGPGVWPSFWLDSMVPAGSSDPSIEIDVFEQYGAFPTHFNSTVIVWGKAIHKGNRSTSTISTVRAGSLTTGFHTYGVNVDPTWIVFYLDRVEFWRTPTPPEHKHGLMLLADLGLGSGWPIDKTPSPSYLFIDYIRAWAPAGK